MRVYFAAKLVKIPNKNNKLDVDFRFIKAHASNSENGHDRGNEAAPEAVRGAEGAKTAPAQP
jgi:hypothetical protein